MSSTEWLPFRAYENVKWLTKDLRVVDTPPLEISGHGKRVRFTGTRKSFPNGVLAEKIRERDSNLWLQIPTSTFTPGASGKFDPTIREILKVNAVYSSEELPIYATRYMRVYAFGNFDRFQIRLETWHSGLQRKNVDTQEFTVLLDAMKYIYKTLRTFDSYGIIGPTGATAVLNPASDTQHLLESLTQQIKAWFDVRANLGPAAEAYRKFRYEMVSAGLALPEVQDDTIAQLLAGRQITLAVNAELSDFAKGAAGALSYDPARCQFVLATQPLISEDLAAEWFAVQQIAEMQGRSDDLRAFAVEYASKLAVQAARKKA